MTTPYRNDREALEQRLTALEAELADARADVAGLLDARARAGRLEREIADLAEKLSRSRRLPMLDDVRIAAPCNAAWGDMQGSDSVRFCGSCQKNVYDLSKLTRREAEELLAANESPCVRLYKRRDGTVITSDCPVGLKRRRFRRIVATAIGGGLLATTTLFARWRTPQTFGATMGTIAVAASAPEPPLMGKVAIAPPPNSSAGAR